MTALYWIGGIALGVVAVAVIAKLVSIRREEQRVDRDSQRADRDGDGDA